VSLNREDGREKNSQRGLYELFVFRVLPREPRAVNASPQINRDHPFRATSA
jgi:hypothetical protein